LNGPHERNDLAIEIGERQILPHSRHKPERFEGFIHVIGIVQRLRDTVLVQVGSIADDQRALAGHSYRPDALITRELAKERERKQEKRPPHTKPVSLRCGKLPIPYKPKLTMGPDHVPIRPGQARISSGYRE